MPNKTIVLTDEEIDRLIEKLDYFGDDNDAMHLKTKILRQQLHNPADVDTI